MLGARHLCAVVIAICATFAAGAIVAADGPAPPLGGLALTGYLVYHMLRAPDPATRTQREALPE